MSKIELPCYGMVIELEEPDPECPGTYLGGAVTSDLGIEDDGTQYSAAMDTIESLVLAHAMAGVDVTTAPYIEGIETAVEAVLNNLSDVPPVE